MVDKDDPLGIVKNGHAPIRKMQINPAGRIYPVTPDGSQWEIRIHMMSDFSKLSPDAPKGEEIIGEVVIRSYNGGLAPLMAMADEAAETAKKLVKKIMAALADAQRQQQGVEIVKELPPNLKGN
jgi:hypothetical protein